MWHGKHIEFFIEGGRSRDGSVLKPRLGILANIVDAFIDADLPKVSLCSTPTRFFCTSHTGFLLCQSGNVALIPVHISYDHPPEESLLIRELMGEQKQRETLWGFLSVRCILLPLSRRGAVFGRLCIDSLPVAVRGGSEASVR